MGHVSRVRAEAVLVQGEAAEAEVCSSPVPCVLVPDLHILGNMTPAASTAMELKTNVIRRFGNLRIIFV